MTAESTDFNQTRSLEHITEGLRASFESTNRAREEALKTSRETIQLSSRAIRALHRGQLGDATDLVRAARDCVDRAKAACTHNPEVFYAGYIHDSQKEYVEAETMLAIVEQRPLPSASVMNVEPAAYLNGIAEAASECRRFVLDRLRHGDMERAESVLGTMDSIYGELITFDFPDAITGGLRRTTDALRAVLERTRGDLTLTFAQHRLERALQLAVGAHSELGKVGELSRDEFGKEGENGDEQDRMPR